jgi:hypothetical protein
MRKVMPYLFALLVAFPVLWSPMPASSAQVFCMAGVPCIGTAGRDNIFGTSGNDDIRGLRGGDNIWSFQGDDVISGGDVAVDCQPDDAISGGAGNDAIYGGAGNDGIAGEGGNDKITGGTGTDLIDGGEGDDFIIIRPWAGDVCAGGTEFINGGPGDDTLCFEAPEVDYVGGPPPFPFYIVDPRTGGFYFVSNVEYVVPVPAALGCEPLAP